MALQCKLGVAISISEQLNWIIRNWRELGRGIPERLRENEEAGEAHGVGEVAEEEAVAVVGIGVGGGGERGGIGGGVVEEVLAGEEVGGVEAEGRFDVEGRAAQTHDAKRQGMGSSSSLTTLTHLLLDRKSVV